MSAEQLSPPANNFPVTEAEFIRPQFAFEREYGQYRNWWARDQRIVGNPFSLLLYLVTHQRTYRITQSRAQSDLGLGKDAFRAARKKLEAAGYLRVEDHRHPAGTVDAHGNSIAGHRRVLLILMDPPQPDAAVKRMPLASADHPPRVQSADAVVAETTLTRMPMRQPSPAVPAANHVGSSSEAQPTTAAPPLNEDQSLEDQSSSVASLELALQALHPGLSLARLRSWLARNAPSIEPARLDLLAASVDVIHAAVRPIGDPVAYVGRSIEREPMRWLERASEDEESVEMETSPGPRRLGSRPPTAAECGARGHRFIGTFREMCSTCGEERPGWREDRDRDSA